MQELLIGEQSEAIRTTGVTINLPSQVSAFMYLLPVSILNKFIFSRLIKRPFYLSTADIIDFVIFGLAMYWVYKIDGYQN